MAVFTPGELLEMFHPGAAVLAAMKLIPLAAVVAGMPLSTNSCRSVAQSVVPRKFKSRYLYIRSALAIIHVTSPIIFIDGDVGIGVAIIHLR